MDEPQIQEITKRLDVLISLVLQTIQRDGHSISLRGQVNLLSELGLRPVEIAKILGKTQTFVNKELTGLRKIGKRGRK